MRKKNQGPSLHGTEAGLGVSLSVYLSPSSKTAGLAGTKRGRLWIRVRAPAKENRANEELLQYVAQKFSVTKASVRLLQGHTNPSKKLWIFAKDREHLAELRSILDKISPPISLELPFLSGV